jgi:hypothetical protein
MPFTLNSTADYHKSKLETLGWELTVSNALYPPDSPCRSILKDPSSYGRHLYEFLCAVVPPLAKVVRIMEIGGGYGYLMRDFMECNPGLKPLMMDISPVLLQKQKDTLKDFEVIYHEGDFLECNYALFEGIELALMNEILGDFPTALDVPADILSPDLSPDTLEKPLYRVRHLYDFYALGRPQTQTFNFNLGAVEAVEKLCKAGVPAIFLGEHSCEASLPEHFARHIHLETSDSPQRIALKGHDEYTIKMSHLQQVAEAHQYRVLRGPFADFLDISYSDSLLSILTSPNDADDRQEILVHFLGDLFQYEYLILVR